MTAIKLIYFLLLAITILISACNNINKNIPLPDDTTAQPVTRPLHFSAVRKIKVSDTEGIQVTTQKLNFNKLPEEVFDSSGFMPLKETPTITHFNWDSLPQSTFNYDKLPSKPLKFETSILDKPKVIQADNF